MISGVPQESVLGPILFLFYINDIPDGIHSTVRLFADDTIMYMSISKQEDGETLQEDLGTKMLKQWVATIDARTRPTHATASGQITDIDETFLVGGTEMKFAGDSAGGAKNVINCRCVIVYVDERDMIV